VSPQIRKKKESVMLDNASGIRDSKSRPAPNCKVQPLGKFSGMILESLLIYSESFVMTPVFP